MTPSHVRRAAAPLLALAVLAGCGDTTPTGPKSFTVRGKLMDGGKPWVYDEAKAKLPPGTKAPPVGPGMGSGAVRMTFHPTDGGDISTANLDATTGTFEAPRVRAGRYKISLTGSSIAPNAAGDPFGGNFTPSNTKIVKDVKEGEEIVIDMGKPTG